MYFKKKFDNDLKSVVNAFKAARYFSPSKVDELKPTAEDIDTLHSFPFLDITIIDNLKSELPKYMAAAEDVSSTVDVISWWKYELPHWANAVRLVVLVQPSSAASERVFSLLNNSFSFFSAMLCIGGLHAMLQYNYTLQK